MSNVFASTSNEAARLKNWYTGAATAQFNDSLRLYKHIEKGKEKFSGLQVIRNVHVRRNPGIGATSDGGNLPSIGKQTTVQATIVAKYNYLRFGLTAPMIKSCQGDKGAFARAMEFEMERGLIDAKNDYNRQLFYDGTGALALVNANAAASTTVVAKGRTTYEDGDAFLSVGMMIDVINSSGVAVASAAEITAMSGSGTTTTLTLSIPVTVSANDTIVRNGSYNLEVQGLLTSLDGLTTSIYGVNRATYPVFQANVDSGSSGQLTLDMIKQTWNKGKKKGDAQYDAIFCDFDTERFYEKLLVSDRRYIATTKIKGDGTFSDKDKSYLEYGGIALVPDKDSPRQMVFLDSSTWKKYILQEWEWADESGSNMIPQTSQDAFEVRLRHFGNFFCEKPNANARLHTYISP